MNIILDKQRYHTVQLVDVLENLCESDIDDDDDNDDHAVLYEILADTDSCDENSDEDFEGNDH